MRAKHKMRNSQRRKGKAPMNLGGNGRGEWVDCDDQGDLAPGRGDLAAMANGS